MKRYFFLIALTVFSCGGSLSEEQRKKIKEEMQNNKIVRVSEVQITEAAFDRGRKLIKIVEPFSDQRDKVDSVSNAERTSIRWFNNSRGAVHPMERTMVEAYESTPLASLEDNVQKIRYRNQETDSLLYTHPVIRNDSLAGVWSVWLSKKKLILSITSE